MSIGILYIITNFHMYGSILIDKCLRLFITFSDTPHKLKKQSAVKPKKIKAIPDFLYSTLTVSISFLPVSNNTFVAKFFVFVDHSAIISKLCITYFSSILTLSKIHRSQFLPPVTDSKNQYCPYAGFVRSALPQEIHPADR